MIRVRVSPPPFWSRDMLDARGWIALPEGARLADALKAIRMPKAVARACFVCVNGALSKPATALQDGDSITFFSIPYGG